MLRPSTIIVTYRAGIPPQYDVFTYGAGRTGGAGIAESSKRSSCSTCSIAKRAMELLFYRAGSAPFSSQGVPVVSS